MQDVAAVGARLEDGHEAVRVCGVEGVEVLRALDRGRRHAELDRRTRGRAATEAKCEKGVGDGEHVRLEDAERLPDRANEMLVAVPDGEAGRVPEVAAERDERRTVDDDVFGR